MMYEEAGGKTSGLFIEQMVTLPLKVTAFLGGQGIEESPLAALIHSHCFSKTTFSTHAGLAQSRVTCFPLSENALSFDLSYFARRGWKRASPGGRFRLGSYSCAREWNRKDPWSAEDTGESTGI